MAKPQKKKKYYITKIGFRRAETVCWKQNKFKNLNSAANYIVYMLLTHRRSYIVAWSIRDNKKQHIDNRTYCALRDTITERFEKLTLY